MELEPPYRGHGYLPRPLGAEASHGCILVGLQRGAQENLTHSLSEFERFRAHGLVKNSPSLGLYQPDVAILESRIA